MPLTPIEKVLLGLITVLAVWAFLWVHLFDQIRGPFSYPSLSEKAAILQELPADWQRLVE